MMSPQLSSDSQPPPRFLSALPQDDPRVGHGLGLPPASVLGAALTGVCVAWTAAAALLLSPVLSPLPVRFGDQSRPASDALGFPFSQLGSGSCLVAEHLQALPREALGPQPLPRWFWIAFLPGFLPGPALCAWSLLWKLALGSPGLPSLGSACWLRVLLG